MQIEQFAHFLAVANTSAMQNVLSDLKGMLHDADADMIHPQTRASAAAFKAAMEHRKALRTVVDAVEVALLDVE